LNYGSIDELVIIENLGKMANFSFQGVVVFFLTSLEKKWNSGSNGDIYSEPKLTPKKDKIFF
jgi:hypothetical protein